MFRRRFWEALKLVLIEASILWALSLCVLQMVVVVGWGFCVDIVVHTGV